VDRTARADSARPDGLPSFLVIGGQKCGTTWLAAMLAQHPDVCVARVKEVHFFNKAAAYARGIDWYRQQFGHCVPGQVTGEFTPNYLWLTRDGEPENEGRNAGIPALVATHLPDVRLIVMLRDPVRRALSAYYHSIRRGRVPPWKSISSVGNRYGILSMGLYHQHVQEWLSHFDRSQFLFLVFENDVLEDPVGTLERVYSFIGVDDGFGASGTHVPRNQRPSDIGLLLSHFLSRRLARRFDRQFPVARRFPVPGLRATDRDIEWLRRYYAEDASRLQDFLGVDLPWSCVNGPGPDDA
jgi:hypothetical protein